LRLDVYAGRTETMQTLLAHWFRIAMLGFLTLGAFLTARIANNYLEAELIRSMATAPREDPPPPPPPEEDRAARAARLAAAITGRDLFDSTPPDPMADEIELVAGHEPEVLPPPGPDDDCRAATGGGALLATMLAEPEDFSVAVVRESGAASRVVKIGDRLREAEVAAIYRERLVLSRFGEFECLDSTTPRRRPPPRWTRPAPVEPVARTNAGIKRLSAYRYRVDRGLIDAHADDLRALGQQIRLRPRLVGGEPDGFEILYVQDDGVFDSLGVHAGDVIRRVNGEQVDTPNKALELFDRLRRTPRVTIDIERRGRPVTLDYRIQ
jgi:general secretion pathway protein C